MTKQQALAAARRRWGKSATIHENRNAAAAAERERLDEERRAASAAIKAIDDGLHASDVTVRAVLRNLVTAATFTCDVSGDEPSLSQLREAVGLARVTLDDIDKRRELRERVREINGKLLYRRWTVKVDRGYCFELVAGGDSLEALMVKIEARPTPGPQTAEAARTSG